MPRSDLTRTLALVGQANASSAAHGRTGGGGTYRDSAGATGTPGACSTSITATPSTTPVAGGRKPHAPHCPGTGRPGGSSSSGARGPKGCPPVRRPAFVNPIARRNVLSYQPPHCGSRRAPSIACFGPTAQPRYCAASGVSSASSPSRSTRNACPPGRAVTISASEAPTKCRPT